MNKSVPKRSSPKVFEILFSDLEVIEELWRKSHQAIVIYETPERQRKVWSTIIYSKVLSWVRVLYSLAGLGLVPNDLLLRLLTNSYSPPGIIPKH